METKQYWNTPNTNPLKTAAYVNSGHWLLCSEFLVRSYETLAPLRFLTHHFNSCWHSSLLVGYFWMLQTSTAQSPSRRLNKFFLNLIINVHAPLLFHIVILWNWGVLVSNTLCFHWSFTPFPSPSNDV